MMGIVTRGSCQKHKIRSLKTNTGINHSITLTEKAAQQFSGCILYETVLSDGILLTSGCGKVVEKIIQWGKV